MNPSSSALRDRVVRFYQAYAPENLGKVDNILERYKGNEDRLMTDLQTKYGKPEPSSDTTTITTPLATSPSFVSPSLQQASSAVAVDSRSYRDRVIRFYEAYAPDNLGKVDGLLEKYKGNEERLLYDLQTKYGKPEPGSTTVSSPPPPPLQSAASFSPPGGQSPARNAPPQPQPQQTSSGGAPTTPRQPSSMSQRSPRSQQRQSSFMGSPQSSLVASNSAAFGEVEVSEDEDFVDPQHRRGSSVGRRGSAVPPPDPINQLDNVFASMRKSVTNDIGFSDPVLKRVWEDAWMGKVPFENLKKTWGRTIIHQGVGAKLTNSTTVQRWQKRYFVLVPHFLYYFDDDSAMAPCKGAVYLERAKIKESEVKGRKAIIITPRVHKKPLEVVAAGDFSNFTIQFDPKKVQDVWVQLLTDMTNVAPIAPPTTATPLQQLGTAAGAAAQPFFADGALDAGGLSNESALRRASSNVAGRSYYQQQPSPSSFSQQQQQRDNSLFMVEDDSFADGGGVVARGVVASSNRSAGNLLGNTSFASVAGGTAETFYPQQYDELGRSTNPLEQQQQQLQYRQSDLPPLTPRSAAAAAGGGSSPQHVLRLPVATLQESFTAPVADQRQQHITMTQLHGRNVTSPLQHATDAQHHNQQHLLALQAAEEQRKLQQLLASTQQQQSDMLYRAQLQQELARSRQTLQVDEHDIKRRIARLAEEREPTQLVETLLTFVTDHVTDLNALWKLMSSVDDLPRRHATPTTMHHQQAMQATQMMSLGSQQGSVVVDGWAVQNAQQQQAAPRHPSAAASPSSHYQQPPQVALDNVLRQVASAQQQFHDVEALQQRARIQDNYQLAAQATSAHIGGLSLSHPSTPKPQFASVPQEVMGGGGGGGGGAQPHLFSPNLRLQPSQGGQQASWPSSYPIRESGSDEAWSDRLARMKLRKKAVEGVLNDLPS